MFHCLSYSPAETKDNTPIEEKPAPPTPGRLVAEPYSWKSLVTGQPILRICTTGSKASVLSLPPGRHVLRFLLQAPHGYHVEMASQTPFVYGDEDTVMACLTKVSFLSCQLNKQVTKENCVWVLFYLAKLIYTPFSHPINTALRPSVVVTAYTCFASTILALKVFFLYDLINKNRGISIPWTEWGCNRKLVVMLLLSLALKLRFLSVPILIISISSFSIPSVSFARASASVA